MSLAELYLPCKNLWLATRVLQGTTAGQDNLYKWNLALHGRLAPKDKTSNGSTSFELPGPSGPRPLTIADYNEIVETGRLVPGLRPRNGWCGRVGATRSRED